MPRSGFTETFAQEIEALTTFQASSDSSYVDSGSYVSYQEITTQWLSAGAKELINMMPRNMLELCAIEKTFIAGTPNQLKTAKIFNVIRDNSPCRKIPSKFKVRYYSKNNINYPSKADPIYWTENSTIDALPGDGTIKYSEVQYPAIEYNHTGVGGINLTGVDAQPETEDDDVSYTGDLFVYTAHGLSTGDKVIVSNTALDSNSSEIVGMEGLSGRVTKQGANGFNIDGVTWSQDFTCNITKIGGFPEDFDYLITLYASMKALQFLMATKKDEKINTQSVDSILAIVDDALDLIDTYQFDNTSKFDNTENYADMIKVKDALDKARPLRTDTAEYAGISDVQDDPTAGTFGALYQLGQEDVEMSKATLELVAVELKRADAHIAEWNAITSTLVGQAKAYLESLSGRMSKMKQEYDWLVGQYQLLKSDYERGVSIMTGQNIGKGR